MILKKTLQFVGEQEHKVQVKIELESAIVDVRSCAVCHNIS